MPPRCKRCGVAMTRGLRGHECDPVDIKIFEDRQRQQLRDAAPDLLEALIEATCWLPGQGDGKTPAQRGAKCETAWDLLKMVNAAIAKAAGFRVTAEPIAKAEGVE